MILFFLPSPAPTRRGAGQDWLQPTAGAPARLDMSVTTVTNLIGKIYVSSGAGTTVHSTNTSSGSQSRLFSLWPKGHRRKWAEPCRTNAPLLHWCSRSGLYVQTPSSRSGLQRHKHTQKLLPAYTQCCYSLFLFVQWWSVFNRQRFLLKKKTISTDDDSSLWINHNDQKHNDMFLMT